MRYFAGLDVSPNKTALGVVDEVGTIIREGKAGSEPTALIAWLATLDVPLDRIGMEAGPLSPWLYEGLREAGYLPFASKPALRDPCDREGIGVILIGMPGIELRLSRYPQLFSRVGFADAYRSPYAARS